MKPLTHYDAAFSREARLWRTICLHRHPPHRELDVGFFLAVPFLAYAYLPGTATPETKLLLEEIARIEEEVAKVKVPPAYGDNLYQLRFHTSIAREKLEALKKAESV